MGKTRRTGDLVTDNNLYVNPTDDSFHVGTGITMYGGSVGIISCTGIFIEGSSVSASVVDDTTPQLGGDLDLNSSDITGTGNINITGGATVSGTVSASDVSVASGHIILNSTGANIIGVTTSTSFSGSGSNLTGLTGASAATYGDASNSAQIVVDANGRITGISEVAISDGGGGSSTLSGLSDVSISSPSVGQVLKYSGSAWVNGTDEGGSGSGISTGKAIAMAMVFG